MRNTLLPSLSHSTTALAGLPQPKDPYDADDLSGGSFFQVFCLDKTVMDGYPLDQSAKGIMYRVCALTSVPHPSQASARSVLASAIVLPCGMTSCLHRCFVFGSPITPRLHFRHHKSVDLSLSTRSPTHLRPPISSRHQQIGRSRTDTRYPPGRDDRIDGTHMLCVSAWSCRGFRGHRRPRPRSA